MKAIYKWTNLQNNKVYIGKSVDVIKRLRGYRSEINKGSQRPIIKALRKYGFDNFKFEIIENCDNLND
jgi:group I intron endonuclease